MEVTTVSAAVITILPGSNCHVSRFAGFFASWIPACCGDNAERRRPQHRTGIAEGFPVAGHVGNACKCRNHDTGGVYLLGWTGFRP